MTTETVLTEEQIQQAVQCITAEQSIVDGSVVLSNVNVCFRELERAVLQSEQVQGLLEDAAAFRLMVERRLTVSVSEVDADVEVFHEGACLAWPPLHQCKDDTERAAVAREAIHLAVSAMEQKP